MLLNPETSNFISMYCLHFVGLSLTFCYHVGLCLQFLVQIKLYRVMMMLDGFCKMCFYRTMSLKIGCVSRKLPLFSSFVLHKVIGWLSALNQWTADSKKMVSIAHSG